MALPPRIFSIDSDETESRRLIRRHEVWRPCFLDLWKQAGIAEGMRVFDISPGPGDTSFDLSRLVGPSGFVVAIEHPDRFVRTIIRRARDRQLANIAVLGADIAHYTWPSDGADAIWGSWALLNVDARENLIAGLRNALKPGGVLVMQEYCDYGAWKLAPRSTEFEAYVSRIVEYWHDGGRDLDVGIALPKFLREAGFEVELVRPQIFAARPDDAIWHWPSGGARRYAAFMAELGVIARDDAETIDAVLKDYEAEDSSVMLTPGVLQIVARKRG